MSPQETAIAEFLGTVTNAAKALADDLTKHAFDNAIAEMRKAFKRDVQEPLFVDRTTSAPAQRNRHKHVDVDPVQQVIDFVAKHPGHRIEHINARIGAKSRDLAAPIRKALASGRLTAKGYGRARKYYPGKK